MTSDSGLETNLPGWHRLEDLAKAAFDEGDLRRARGLLEEASSTAGSGPSVFANLGMVCLELGDYRRAVQAYSALPVLDVDERVNRGLAYERIGETESARADYRAALALDHRDVAALINLGTLELSAGSVELARELLERAHAIDSTAGWQLSDALRARGDLEGAVDALNSAIRAGESRAYLDLADIERERGNVDASNAARDAAIAAGIAHVD